MRIRLQRAIYFCLHTGKCPLKGGRMASPLPLFELALVFVRLRSHCRLYRCFQKAWRVDGPLDSPSSGGYVVGCEGES